MIARVEPLVTARALEGPFDYRLPERLAGVEVGSVLLVPFGPRRLLGVVVEIARSSELAPERLAEPIRALEAGVPADLVRLAQWVAREYCSTPARALELVLPPGTRRSGRQAQPRRRELVRATGPGRAALGDGSRLGERQRTILERLRDGELPAAELPADRAALRRLAARGLVEIRSEEVSRRPAAPAIGAPPRAVELSPAQAAAVAAVGRALDLSPGAERELLLHGVTGSGKTEVYLAATAAALERGRGAIVLVPEIALTPQTMARFAARFGDAVALLHSRLGDGERRDEWMRLRRGEAQVAVGPRSAAFAPVAGLGLVVVDEEHDSSYKQESDPRYDARDVVRRRAADAGAVLLCGTATPRPESWLALERLELAERADGAALPDIEVLDMRGVEGSAGPLHPSARDALAELARGGGKGIVMLNRRGWSPHLACRSCGHVWQCPQCDVSLVTHRHTGALRCHHCGHAEPIPDACPQCGSVTLARSGTGTERLERILAELVAPLPVLRLDTDSAARARAHAEILGRFERADGGLLVGTQMVAKGHDFPDVVLSLILDADATLRFPDFRAEERTFALVSQLAGRSGRGARGGRVLVQTLAPDAEPIVRAARHDTAGFVAAELARRRALRYPPFGELIRIELAAAVESRVEAAARRLTARLEADLPAGAELLGPAPRFRLRGRHRRQLLLKAVEGGRTPAVAAVREAVRAAARARELRDVAIAADVDPQ
ncbi:MAG TPA: primosomal protein N' [Solirubrobacterales bacterium]|nr:primosomal protein N' [Solirubrobacterales bacterium]